MADGVTRVKRRAGEYYNGGLLAAREGRLTDAVEALEKSLRFDGSAKAPRNLLGLINFKIGRLTEATKQWVISSNIEKRGNRAAVYLDMMQNEQKNVDRMNEATIMYNHALEYVQRKSDDLAVIQLKRALDLNPEMLDALNLLSLIHLMANEKGKAAAYIERALALDRANKTALTYYHEAGPRHGAGYQRTQNTAATRLEPPKRANSGIIAQIIGFLFGAALTAAVVFLLVIPSNAENYQRQIDDLVEDNDKAAAGLEAARRYSEDNQKLFEATIAEIYSDSDDLKARLDIQERVNKIQNANAMYVRGEYREAIDYLATIPLSGLPQSALTLVDDTMNAAIPALEQQYYEEGKREFNARNYEEAKAVLLSALEYIGANGGDIYYYLGRTCYELDDALTAKAYFAHVIDDYPDSINAADAKRRYNRIPD